MKKKIGIVGGSGRMGANLAEIIAQTPNYDLGANFSRKTEQDCSIDDIFIQSDYVVDFSHHSMISDILDAAIKNKKPLLICTTGINHAKIETLLKKAGEVTVIVITSNTSIGAYLQRSLVKQISAILGAEYDIDILEKHHRNKADSPSGTTLSLVSDISYIKKSQYNLDYALYEPSNGPRTDNSIGIASQRSGNIFGEHEVIFTSKDELISIKHVALNRILFARGAIKIIDWIEKTKPQNGVYGIDDVFSSFS